MKETTTYFPHLDGWRALAIVAVFFGHFFAKAHFWWVGQFGVQLFFVLSGFLMCNILFFKKAPLPGFFVKRLIRVAPTFILFVAVITIYVENFQRVAYAPSISEFFSTLFFLRSYFPSDLSITNDQWPIGHLWSRNVEEHSYIFLAAMAFLTRQINRKWITFGFLLAATVVVLMTSYRYFLHPPPGATLGNMRSEAASLGIIAVVTISYGKRHWLERFSTYVPSWLPLASIVIAFLCFSTYRWRGLHFTVAPLCLAFAINYLDRIPATIIKILSIKPLRWIGQVSFSLYLWQQPFHFALCQYDVNVLVALPLAIATGIFSYYSFENPIRLWLSSKWEARERRAVDMPATTA